MCRARVVAAVSMVMMAIGCNRGDSGFGESMSETDGDSSGDADATQTTWSSASTTSSDATSNGATSSTSDETGGSSGSETTESVDDTGDTTTTTATTTGGPAACMHPAADELDIVVMHEGNEIGVCGYATQLHGPLVAAGNGSWTIRSCGDSCAQDCVGDEIELTIAGPAVAVPTNLPDCIRAHIEWFAYENNDPDVCSWSGVAVYEAQGGQFLQPPLYLASQQIIDPPMNGPWALTVGATLAEACTCEDPDLPGCCSMEPGRYDLEFDHPGVFPQPVTVAHASSTIQMVVDDTYTVANVSSLMSGECDAVPEIRWAIVRE